MGHGPCSAAWWVEARLDEEQRLLFLNDVSALMRTNEQLALPGSAALAASPRLMRH